MSLSYSIIIQQSPNQQESLETAANFIASCIELGHSIDRVFLYMDAVYAALNSQVPPQGQQSAIQKLIDLKQQHGFALQACIANSLRRGVINDSEAERYEKQANLLTEFELTGLGEITEACQSSDRIITL